MRNVSLAEMRDAGVTLDANESVAITQLLIKTPPAAHDPGVIPPVVAGSRTETAPGASRPRVRRAAMKRVTRPASGTAAAPPASPAPRRGVLDRLHLGWLRVKVVVRDDL